MSRRTNSVAESGYPIVSVQRFQSIKCDVDTRQLEELGQYTAYVESVRGEKPTDGEVVGAALAELFKLDRGFQKWKEQHQKPDVRTDKAPEMGPRIKA